MSRLASAAAIVLWGVSPSVSACGGDVAGGAETVERDSAGFIIVENGPLSAAAEFVRVDPLPEIEIGALDGPVEYQLFRVVGAHRLPGGVLLIANGGSHELRFYGPDGRHLRSVGAEGEGPGEFRGLERTWVRGDSIFAFDSRNRRFSVFDLQGALGRAYSVGDDLQFGSPSDLFEDAASLVQRARVFTSGEERSGLDRADRTVAVYDRDGRLETELGRWPGRESFVHTGADFMAVRGLTFGRALHTAVSADRAVIAMSDTLAFDILGRDGTLERRVRAAEALRAVEPGAFERVLEGVLEDSPEEMRGMWRDMFDAMPRHETYPAFWSIRTDGEGKIWLEDYRAPDEERRAWSVFSPAGHALGRVRMPDGLTVLEIGPDYVIGLVRDELDVERVRLHRFLPPQALETAR